MFCYIIFRCAWELVRICVSKEIKKRKLAKFPVNATDDYKMKKGKPAFTFPSPTGAMVIHVWLRPMSKPAPKTMKAFNYELDDK